MVSTVDKRDYKIWHFMRRCCVADDLHKRTSKNIIVTVHSLSYRPVQRDMAPPGGGEGKKNCHVGVVLREGEG